MISLGHASFLLMMVMCGILGGCNFARLTENGYLPSELQHLNKGVRLQKEEKFEAAIEEEGALALEEFSQRWDKRYPRVSVSGRRTESRLPLSSSILQRSGR